MAHENSKTPDFFARWRDVTSARIGLGRAGQAMPTGAMLDFLLSHARARDAVHSALDVEKLKAELDGPAHHVFSRACDRAAFLQNPTSGRKLSPDCVLGNERKELAIVLADGLSATAIQDHGAKIANALKAQLSDKWTICDFVIAEQSRVALGDEIGEQLGADVVVVLIGERPGLSAADSVGAYITWKPKSGRADSERNCISNIREPGGLSLELGAANIAWIVNRAKELSLTGVGLKDRFADEVALKGASSAPNQITGEGE
ncbi:ethanolamine ammonia-lyase subunit EutC [Ponticaulis sp.]|uniref:ethanolamine ammonia-lyase subunit EutC n=1 Tax=Ponticaulis sp. TaxID=2020902 RepID=UPI000B68BA82|nr:ethanolamine ammonia-lyase subunit EutC [Ponticaulis sp.]MAI89564.1 ethanolamine ammonia-lyase [Ponticaulis sp.]OUY00592.1 MAG: hypothetical protein CBB65_03920 [Hyphomonadaceae bacterium TMED5]